MVSPGLGIEQENGVLNCVIHAYSRTLLISSVAHWILGNGIPPSRPNPVHVQIIVVRYRTYRSGCPIMEDIFFVAPGLETRQFPQSWRQGHGKITPKNPRFQSVGGPLALGLSASASRCSKVQILSIGCE